MFEATSFPVPQNASQSSDLKIQPYSLEAEQSVIGGLMIANDTWDRIADIIAPEDFYRPEHKMVFEVMMGLAEANEPFDVVTLSEKLEQSKQLIAVGGLAYLGEVAKNTPSAGNIVHYAKIVRERSVLRQLITVTNEIAEDAFNPLGRKSSEILDTAENKVFQIAERSRQRSGPLPVKELVTKAVERIDQLYSSDSQITGVSTGFNDLDDKTSGLQYSDLIIVAGRPSMGKTAFAMNLVENALLKDEKSVLVFSMEMSAESLVMRMMSSLGRIDQNKIRTGKLTDEDWPRLTATFHLLENKPLYIDDTPALSPIELRSRARRLAREQKKLDLIIIDYLQLMQVPGRGENRVAEISEISRSLKALAKELDVPIVALSQLNRGLEQRPNKRPVMSDLRESGAIEQDADLIMFIYRDEVYNEDSMDKGIAEIIIGKQRNGPIGTTRLTFLGKYTRFEDIADTAYEGYQ